MSTTVKVSEAKSHLSEALVGVEADEEVIIACGNDPIARLSKIRKETDFELRLNEVRSIRHKLQTVTHD